LNSNYRIEIILLLNLVKVLWICKVQTRFEFELILINRMENNKQHCATGLGPQCPQPTQRKWSGPQEPFGPVVRNRRFNPPPPSPARLHRPIQAGRRRLIGEGGAREEAWNKGKPWVVVGWTEAHHNGISTVVVLSGRGNDDAGPVAGSRCSGNWSTSSWVLRWSYCWGRRGQRTVGAGYRQEALDGRGMTTAALARTGGRRWWRCRRGQTTDSSGPSWSGGEARDARMAAVDVELLTDVVSDTDTSASRLW
jgi:hypothetical protein